MAKISAKPKNRKGTPPVIEEASNIMTNQTEKSTGAKKDLNFKVDPEFKRRFKSYAANQGISMVDLLSMAFEYYVVNNSETAK